MVFVKPFGSAVQVDGVPHFPTGDGHWVAAGGARVRLVRIEMWTLTGNHALDGAILAFLWFLGLAALAFLFAN